MSGTGAEERSNLVEAIADDGAAAHLTLAWRPKPGEYRAYLVGIEAGLGGEFLDLARNTATQLADHRVEINYDPEWPLKDSEYFALEGDEIPGGNLFPDLEDFLKLERFEKRSMRKPRLYTVAIQADGQTALFGKRMANLKQLGRRKNLFTAVWDGNAYNRLRDTVSTFSTNFDWVLWNEVLYVLDSDRFHAEFRDQAALRAAVKDHVDQISQHVAIAGSDAFIERCQASVPMASKLRSVAEHGIWDRPVAELKTYAQERGIEVQWDGDSLVFDGTIEHQHAILKLLDEDRTEGPVSGRTYDSAAKQAVELPPKD